MEYLFEFVLELILEGSIEVSKNRKIPKYIRYPLIAIIILFFLAIIGIIFLTGILSIKENIFVGIVFLLLGLYISIMSIIQFKKTYCAKINQKESIEQEEK